MSDLVPILWRYIENSANIIGAALRPALIGKAGHTALPLGKAECFCSTNNNIFTDFLYSLRFNY
jgi:hypothetical protein